MNDNSHEAYNNVKPKLGLIQEQIMSHLPEINMHETHSGHNFSKSRNRLTVALGCAPFHEIAYYTNLPEQTVWKRLPELEKKGLVRRRPEKFKYRGSDGRLYKRTIWEVVK